MDLKLLHEAAGRELARHNLADWSFRLANTKRRLGVCKHRYKLIEISGYYALNSPDEQVMDTLLHEIAHALAGPKAGHGPAWKKIAVQLGATPKACDDSPETKVVPGDWQATCAGCGRTHHRYKAPKYLSGFRCRCPARSPLVFEYKGHPAFKPNVPMSAKNAAGWQGKCDGCGTVHHRLKRPRAGVWKCMCPAKGIIQWTFVVPG